MTANSFDLLCLFGFSPHFRPILNSLIDSKVEAIIIYGPRQKDSVDSLDLPGFVQKLCVNSLDDVSYQKIKVRTRSCLGLSFGSPFIFTQKDIDDFGGKLINSHGAPLPDFKGGGGFSWRILQRDKRGALLMHFVTTKIDEGACVFRRDFIFSEHDRFPCDFEKRQLREESEHLIPWIKNLILGQTELSESLLDLRSSKDSGSYFPRLSADLHGCIDWSLSFSELEALILAFSRPYPGAFTFVRGEKVRIMDVKLEEECFMHPFTYGLVLSVGAEGLRISANNGIISIRYEDLCFDAGNIQVRCGDRFCTPNSILQKSLFSRVFYKPNGLVARDDMPTQQI